MIKHNCNILIIGGGPAGIAAANAIINSGKRITIVDDNPSLGGQIWRKEYNSTKQKHKGAKLDLNKVTVIHATVISSFNNKLYAEGNDDSTYELSYDKLILATGARELFIPFPGWTLPGVLGAGGLQALVKGGLPINGKRVVVAGSGPLLLAVAAYLKKHGADVKLIAEQTSMKKLLRFGVETLRHPSKIFQAIGLKKDLLGVPFLTNAHPVEAITTGEDSTLTAVKLKHNDKDLTVECDYLACGFHLIPSLELPMILGCETNEGAVVVDDYQRTSIPIVYCAGESTGIGGLELSLTEGKIAALSAINNLDEARKLFSTRQSYKRFADAMNECYSLRFQLKHLCNDDTIICRCEDVQYGKLRKHESWRAAKLQTRCGMGHCQGRVCGGAVEFLFDWKMTSVRPPLFPVKLQNIMTENTK